jgi:predicted amidohydrolase
LAPEGAQSVLIRLSVTGSPAGTVWWDGVRFEEVAPPKGRPVRVLTVKHRPQQTASAAASLEEFCRIVEGAASRKPDIVCLPEGVTVVGTGRSYADVAESLAGPSTRRLGATAAKLSSYIVAGVYEKSGDLIYNTAVLIDRQGNLAGSYRKTHLPYEEVEGGITAGDSYPVFRTDFGTIGILICWDSQFPEPWRAMASRGAELFLLPIWGGSETLTRARAIENTVFVVSSSYDMKTFVVDPEGKVVVEATDGNPVALAEIDLARKYIQPWIGDMKTRTWKERRPDIPVR